MYKDGTPRNAPRPVGPQPVIVIRRVPGEVPAHACGHRTRDGVCTVCGEATQLSAEELYDR